jgi:uncharacterized protein YcnI
VGSVSNVKFANDGCEVRRRGRMESSFGALAEPIVTSRNFAHGYSDNTIMKMSMRFSVNKAKPATSKSASPKSATPKSATRQPMGSRSFTRRFGQVSVSAAVLLVGPLAIGAPAHIDPKPSLVKAGSTVVVTFGVEHGCADSPTTKLAIKLPTGVSAETPKGPKGFVAEVNESIVSFSGGSLPKAGAFSVTLTFPKTVGVLSFPVVQTCAKGSTSWIGVTSKSNPKPKTPAPQIRVK